METKNNNFANPAPLGLLGFGMTTILLNLHNAGLTNLNSTILAMGLALGGAAQIIAGIVEFKNKNTFGATAFTAYGFFWLSLVVIFINPFTDKIPDASLAEKGYYLLLWGIFTLAMFIGTLKHNKISQIIFGSLAILFILLSIGDFSKSEVITKIAGYIGIFCGLSAIYSSVGQIINQEYQKNIFPLI